MKRYILVGCSGGFINSLLCHYHLDRMTTTQPNPTTSTDRFSLSLVQCGTTPLRLLCRAAWDIYIYKYKKCEYEYQFNVFDGLNGSNNGPHRSQPPGQQSTRRCHPAPHPSSMTTQPHTSASSRNLFDSSFPTSQFSPPFRLIPDASPGAGTMRQNNGAVV